MLPPFKIRNLRRSASGAPLPRANCTVGVISLDSVVEISAPAYDTTVARYPEAMLKYFDEEDCDIITVGSSLELSQRLEDPLPELPGLEQEHHIFDIEHGVTASKIWLKYEQTEQTADSKAIQVQQCMPAAQSLLPEGQKDVEIRVPSMTDLPEHQGRPKSAMIAIDQKAEQTSQQTSQPISQQLTLPHFHYDAPSSSYLTLEGKRQARAAGDRLRAIANPSRYSRKSSNSMDTINTPKRWASNNMSSSPFFEHLAHPAVNTDTPNRDNKRQPQSAGDKVRGRSSRTRHPKSAQGLLIDYGISKTRCANSSVPRMVRSEDDDTHPKKFRESSDRDHTKKEPPKSLLQLFESELSLAKNSTRGSACSTATIMQSAKATHDGGFSNANGISLKVDRPNDYFSDNDPQHPRQRNNPSPSTDMPSSHSSMYGSIGQAVNAIRQVIVQLQKLKSDPEHDRSCQRISHTLQLGLSAALESFSAYVQAILETVQSSSADKKCNTEDLQKILTIIRCSKIDFVMPITSDSRSRNSIQPQAHSQTVQVPSTSKDDEVYSHGCMKAEGRSGPLHPSGDSKIQNEIEASASLINASTTSPSPSPYDGASLDYELTRDAAHTLATALPPYSEMSRDHHVANVFPQPQDFVRNSRPRSEILDLSYKVPDVPYEAPRYSHSVLDTSRNDELCRGTISQMMKSPPLPMMKPLKPAREADPSDGEIRPREDLRLHENLNQLGSAAIRRPRVVGSKATIIPKHFYETESSGQFFNRMTGRGNRIAIFPDSDPACNYGIERRATIGERSGSSNWRPFTTDLSDNARLPRDSLFQKLQTPVRSQCRKPQGSDGRTNAVTSNLMTTNKGGRQAGPADVAYAIDHSDAATAGKIQECVEQLQTLGFCNNTNDGLGRLIVYAQAAEGDLANAIDIIDEEQQAYSQRR